MNRLWPKLWVTAGWLGFSPFAPGTCGSLGAVVLALAVHRTISSPHARTLMLAGLILLFSGVTVLYGEWAERAFGRKDPPQVVSDEVAGMLLAVLFVPEAPEWLTLGVGFLLFRAFDILKPPPLNRLQALPGGMGILLDDLGAGLLANAGLQLLLRGFATYHGL